ncbi:MAG TPA: hypothetical protein VHZ28_05695 [Terracidiphilus sp.]|nr:hypothetical protein [Terracidiphilus sp.]
MSPTTLTASNSKQSLTLNGTNFQSGATVTYHDPQGNTSAGHATTFVSAGQIVDSAFTSNNTPGTWTVTVVNPNSTNSNSFSFAVAGAPTITGVSPSPVTASAGAQTLTINGSNFQSGATVTYQDSLGNVSAGHTATFVNTSQIVDNAFNTNNTSGNWTVTVVDPNNISSNAFSFTVTANSQAPTITGVSPSPVPATAGVQPLTINGSNFQSGATVTYQDPQGNVSAGHAAAFASASQLVDNAFDTNNSLGNWTVTVVNPNNIHSNSFSFTVITPPPFTLVQQTSSTCTSSPCADEITSTTQGNLLVLFSEAKYSGTGSAIAATFSGASGDGTWTHCPNSVMNYVAGVNPAYALDCWYTLSSAGGATSVSATWTFAGLTSPGYAIADELFELHPTSTPVYYDTGNASTNFINCSTTCTGPAALLSGPDAVLQAAMLSSLPTAISTPYAAPDILSNVKGAFSSALDQSSYSLPTWQGTALSNPNLYSTAAFGNNPSPTPTLDLLIDFSACTPGAAPTIACLANSTFTGAHPSGPSLSSMGPNLIVTNNGPSSSLPIGPTIFNGLSKTGTNTPNLGCTTSGSGNSCGPVGVGFDMVPTSISIAYTVESSCPVAPGVDCGAIGGIFSKAGALDFDVVHLSPLGNGKICFETQGGSGCTPQTMLDYTPNMAYRVNMQINNYPAPTNFMTVCADGPGGAVLGTWSNGAVAAYAVDDVLVLGISGEEPKVAGYTFSWRNVAVSFTGQFSTTSCF